MPLTDTKLHSGELAPDFSLPSLSGPSYRLTTLLKSGPVLLVFFRGTWCSSCRTQLMKLEHNYSDYQRRGVQLIGIAHQRADIVANYFKREPITFPYLLDSSLKVITDYGMLRTIPDAEWQPIIDQGFADRLGLDSKLLQLNGPRVAYPAMLLIRPDRTIMWMYVGSDPYDWPSESMVEEQLALLK